jgi:hypothetical protein
VTDLRELLTIDPEVTDYTAALDGHWILFRRFEHVFRLPLPPDGYRWHVTANELYLRDRGEPLCESVCWDMPGGEVHCSASTGLLLWAVSALQRYWRHDA